MANLGHLTGGIMAWMIVVRADVEAPSYILLHFLSRNERAKV